MLAVWNAILSPLTLALGGYVALVTALALLVQPLRIRMVDLVEEMLAEEHWNEAQRDTLNQLLDTSMSFKVGVLMIAATISVILDDLLRRPAEIDDDLIELGKDQRFYEAASRYFVSIMAINPIAALIFIPMVVIEAIVETWMGRPDVRLAVEEPVMRASAAMPRVRAREDCLEAA